MDSRSVLISGASIAGPALALWLDRYGFEVTVVEKADGVRRGGQPVDFKGQTHRTVLTRMGILDAVEAAKVGSSDGAIVDARGRTIGRVPGEFSGGEINVPRGELSQILYERTQNICTYLFGDSITSLTDTGSQVEVTFARSAPRRFDLVVGADGIHSNVRRLVFGPEADFVRYLGYHYAHVSLPSDADQMYNEPGRMVATSGTDDPAFFVFRSGALDFDRDDIEQQKRLLADAYEGGAWRIPELLDEVASSDDFWMDAISRVIIDRYATGRVALVGDAAYGNALGGFGTGLSLVGAYVLAGELAGARDDHRAAFHRYEQLIRPYARSGQKINAGRLLAPSNRVAIVLRNRLFSVAVLFGPMMGLFDRFASDIRLPDYPR